MDGLAEHPAFPSDWPLVRVKEVASIATGSRNTQDRKADGKYPFFVRSQTVERIDSYSFVGEAVLTAGDGVGTGKVFHYINGPFDCHQRVYRISEFAPCYDGRFFYYYFSHHFYDRIMSMTAKSSVDSVRMEMIADMEIPCPSRSEQEAIASALDDVEALALGLEAVIAKKRGVEIAAAEQLLSGRLRLNGSTARWRRVRLGDVGSTFGGLTGKSGADFGRGSGRYVTFLNVIRNVIVDPAELSPVVIRDAEVQAVVRPGDLLLNGSSETPEEVGMASAVGETLVGAYLNSFCFGFRIRADAQLDPVFVAYLLRSGCGRALIYSLAQGATRYNLSKAAFLDLVLTVPPMLEQKAIASVLIDLDAELSLLEVRLAKTRDLKLAMAQELLSGRTRLA